MSSDGSKSVSAFDDVRRVPADHYIVARASAFERVMPDRHVVRAGIIPDRFVSWISRPFRLAELIKLQFAVVSVAAVGMWATR
jgi:hypothetical protein